MPCKTAAPRTHFLRIPFRVFQEWGILVEILFRMRKIKRIQSERINSYKLEAEGDAQPKVLELVTREPH